MISGTTSGAISIKPNTSRPRNLPKRAMANPAQVPSASARLAAMTPISRLFSAASRNRSSPASAAYQRDDQPPHTVTSREALNE